MSFSFKKEKHTNVADDPYKDRYVDAETQKLINSRKMGKEKREDLLSTLFLVPSLIGVVVFFIAPFFIVMYYALIDNPIHNKFVWIKNFIMVMKNPAFMKASLNTVIFSFLAVPLAVVLSLVLAMVLEMKLPLRSQLRSFFLSPLMVPTASIVLIWKVLFHANGTVNSIITSLGGTGIDWLNSKYAQIVLVCLFLWKNLGYNMILFMAALSSIPKDALEAAMLEKITKVQIFFHIKIRYITSTILFVTIMSLINSFKVFREVYLMKGDYPYETMYLLQHFMNNTFKSLDYQKMSAAAIIMAVVMSLIIGGLFKLENKLSADVEAD